MGLSYRAPWWLPGGHLQTLYAALAVPRTRVAYTREQWQTPDGDVVEVDWLSDSRTRSGSLVALFHGLEGGSRSHYAHALMAEIAQRGSRAVVVHFRGCGGSANRMPRAYHSGDTEELEWMLRRLKTEQTDALFAMGVSLGGNALLKWLGERGAGASKLVERAAAVSAPVDLMAAGDALAKGFNRIYTLAFLRTLKRKALAMAARHPGLLDTRKVRAARTLRNFDDAVTAPLHGFLDTDDYWTRASSKRFLRDIGVPTLMINALNDPFMPASALPDREEVSDFVTREFPETGGHVGFVTPPFPGTLSWLPRRILAFFDGHSPC